MTSLLVNGLSDQHKEFLYAYAQKELGSKSRTQAILHLINEKMSVDKKEIDKSELSKSFTNNEKKRVQISLLEHDYYNLLKVAEKSDTSIYNYIIRLILKDLYNENRLLGVEIEQLRKSNYELHKIGVNINQIARALNSGDNNGLVIDLMQLNDLLKKHVDYVMNILSENVKRY